MVKKRNCYNDCNSFANQYMFLVAIFSSILSEEIEDPEDLGILGSFLIAMGEELSLAAEIRILCKARAEKQSISENQVVDVFSRESIHKNTTHKKVKKRVKKKK